MPTVTAHLTPDLAYVLGPQIPTKSPTFDVLIQMRQDKEVVESDKNHQHWINKTYAEHNISFDYRDWWYHPDKEPEEYSAEYPLAIGDVRLNYAIDMVSSGRVFITNRYSFVRHYVYLSWLQVAWKYSGYINWKICLYRRYHRREIFQGS